MDAPKDVDSFIAQADPDWQPGLRALREVLAATDLEESIKWRFPVYSFGKKNVAGIGIAKTYAGVWFFQGALLSDPAGRLVNAQEGKTVALRQLRFASPEDIDLELVQAYIDEAIENQRMGLELKPQAAPVAAIPPELAEVFATQSGVAAAFEQFPPYKQREFCEHISSAKRAATKQNRLEKIIPMILGGVGLSDKYRPKK
ncbi:MAG: DUF1801 domain-containing protein [Bacteroidota bacterium]